MQIKIPVFSEAKAPSHLNLDWQRLYERCLQRKITVEKPILPITFFADNGISDTIYAKNGGNYTSSFAILASENLLHPNPNLISVNIGIKRYFAELGHVLDVKVSSGSKNFLETEALEPQRLKNALAKGYEIVSQIKNSALYLHSIGSCSELAAECLIKSLWQSNAPIGLANKSERLNLLFENLVPKDNHPFSHLEKFGGYETAALVGSMFAAIENENLIFIEGAAPLAAMSVVLKMFPECVEFFQIVGFEKSSVFSSFCEHLALNRIFNLPPAHPKLFYLSATEDLIKQVLEATTSV